MMVPTRLAAARRAARVRPDVKWWSPLVYPRLAEARVRTKPSRPREPPPGRAARFRTDEAFARTVARGPHRHRTIAAIVLAYHVIFGTYGFWLPNDPRGSWSDWIASWELLRRAGAARRRPSPFEPAPAGARRPSRAEGAIRLPTVVLNDDQLLAVGRGFGRIVGKCGFLVSACGIGEPARAHGHWAPSL